VSWPQVKLESVFEIARGGSPRPIDDYITDADDGLNWISIKDASNSDKYIEKTKLKIKPEGLSKTRQVKPGDFLLTNSMSFGRPYIMKTTGCIHDGWLVLSGNPEKVDSDYFYHLLGSDLLKRRFSALAAGAVVKNLNIDLVKGVEIPLPPLPEQKRIAAILDKADAIRRKRQQAIQLADDFLRAVFLDMFGDPVTNPKGWPVKPFGSLVINKDGKRIPIKASDRSDMAGQYPYYGASGVIDYVNDFIFEGAHLLIGEDGANLLARSTPIAFIADGQYWVNNHAHVLGEKDGVPLEYLAFSINLRSLEPFVSGSAQPKLNQENLNKIPVQVPPAAVMEKFLTTLKKHRAYMGRVSESEPESLFSSLSQIAFSGQL